MATEKQTTLIEQLADERVMDPDDRNRLMKRLRNGDLNQETASLTIAWLFKQPRKPQQEKFIWRDGDVHAQMTKAINIQDPRAAHVLDDTVPEGRYAIGEGDQLRFYKVKKPTEGKWEGFTFVEVQAGDELWPVKGTNKFVILKIIAEDPKAAMLRYGTELGHCGHCGRTLTNAESRERGIGPVCAKEMGF